MIDVNKNYVHYDFDSDAIQIAIKSGEEENYKEIIPGVNVELNKDNEVIGIEILRASRFFKPIASQLNKKMELV